MKKVNESIFNPALMFGIGLFPLLVLATSFKSAIIFGSLVLGTIIISTLLYYAFKPIILENVRIPIYALIVFSSIYFLDSAISELFVNSYTVVHSLISFVFATSIVIYALERNKEEEKLGVGLKQSVYLGLEYIVSLSIVGVVREFLGSGTIWGKTIIAGFNGLEFFLGVAGGILIIVIYALIYNSISYFIKKRKEIQSSLALRYEMFLDAYTAKNNIEQETKEEQKKESEEL